MRARKGVGIGLSYQATQPGGIGSLESFIRLLISLKIRALEKRCLRIDSPVTEFGPHVEPLVEGHTVHNHLEYNDNGSYFEGRLRHGLNQ
jgi:hypothetical protein